MVPTKRLGPPTERLLHSDEGTGYPPAGPFTACGPGVLERADSTLEGHGKGGSALRS